MQSKYVLSNATAATLKLEPTMCFRKESLNTVMTDCENKTECKIFSTVNYFGDPCVGVKNKHLMLQYQCLDQTSLLNLNRCPKVFKKFTVCPTLTNSFTQFQRQWCEPARMIIACKADKKINILCAYYGIDTSYRCDIQFFSLISLFVSELYNCNYLINYLIGG